MQPQRAESSAIPILDLTDDQEFVTELAETTTRSHIVELSNNDHQMSQMQADLLRQEPSVQSPTLKSHQIATRQNLVFGKKYQKCGVTGQIAEYTHVIASGPYSGDTKDPYTNMATYLASGLTKQSNPEIYCRHEQDLEHFIVDQWYRADKITGRMILVKKEEIPVGSVGIPSRIQYREAGYNVEDHPKMFWKYCLNPMYSKYYHH